MLEVVRLFVNKTVVSAGNQEDVEILVMDVSKP
jgi:hypothetical protein